MSINNIGSYGPVRNYNNKNHVNSYTQTSTRSQSSSGCCCCNRNPINFLTDYHNTMLNLVSSADALRNINSSGIMGDYTVSSSNENVASAVLRWLMRSSNKTGTSNQFAITGSLGAAAGVDQVAVNAENASYRVISNGQSTSRASESNDIWLETGKIGVTLKGTGSADISVHVMRQLKNLSRSPLSLTSLKSLGLKRNGDGATSFDKDVFRNNLNQHPAMTRGLLSGQFGFAQRVY